MKLFKTIKTDLYLGLWKKWRFIVFIGISLFACNSFGELTQSYIADYGKTSFTIADCIAFIWKGAPEMKGLSVGEQFFLPPIWLVLVLMFLMIPIDYPIHSMEIWGNQYLIRLNRKTWWISKCLYVIFTNTITYFIYLVITALYCVWNHISLSFHNNGEFYYAIFGEVLEKPLYLQPGENFILLVIIPMLGLYAMSLLQLFISIWLSPLVAYVVSMAILVFSVYSESFWLIGNQTMIIRSKLIHPTGIPVMYEIFWCLTVCTAIVVIGLFCIHKKDMLVLKKEDA